MSAAEQLVARLPTVPANEPDVTLAPNVAANDPLSPRAARRVYRLVTHPGVAPDRGEPLVVGWLRSLLDEHDEADVDASRASGRLHA